MLTDSICKSAICPQDKHFKRFFDSGGMYLEVTKAGGKYWRLKYRYENKEKRLALTAFIKQTNIAHGHQQVNNSVENNQLPQNELLEEHYGSKKMDERATIKTK